MTRADYNLGDMLLDTMSGETFEVDAIYIDCTGAYYEDLDGNRIHECYVEPWEPEEPDEED